MGQLGASSRFFREYPMSGAQTRWSEVIVDLHPNYHFRWEEPQQAYVLLYPEGIVKLNKSAAEIIGACLGGRSVIAIAAELSARYDGRDVSNDVVKFLEVAHAKGWIWIKS